MELQPVVVKCGSKTAIACFEGHRYVHFIECGDYRLQSEERASFWRRNQKLEYPLERAAQKFLEHAEVHGATEKAQDVLQKIAKGEYDMSQVTTASGTPVWPPTQQAKEAVEKHEAKRAAKESAKDDSATATKEEAPMKDTKPKAAKKAPVKKDKPVAAKGKEAKPKAKGAAAEKPAKKSTGAGRITDDTVIKAAAPERARSGTMKVMMDWLVAQAGKKATRAAFVKAMKQKKEDEARVLQNISWGVRNGFFAI